MDLPLSMIHLGDSPETIALPLPAYLIEHDRGLVLLDAGLRPDAHEKSPADAYGEETAATWPMRCPPENRLDLQIKKAGFDVSDVTHVLVSHMHLDHIGGLYLFPQAEFYASAAELRYAYWPQPFWESAFGRDDLDRTRGFKWNLLEDEDLDLFGDGSLQFLSTPGHTIGHRSLLVKLPSRNIMLAVDIGHTLKNYEGIPCPGDLDGTTAFQSIQRVKRISAATDAEVWIAHDVETWERLGNPAEAYS
jgi:glyoxylase-like metal-dependent hydrolase (beta-lactamase superfamily II)